MCMYGFDAFAPPDAESRLCQNPSMRKAACSEVHAATRTTPEDVFDAIRVLEKAKQFGCTLEKWSRDFFKLQKFPGVSKDAT